tara:strand:- start:611 stop:838 length:228 start_codon:yes stop_codon:yes gene_type:complete
MGRKKRSRQQAPTPPPIVEAPAPVMEADLVGQEGYADAIQDNQMTMQSTLLTSPLKKKKKENPTTDGGTMMGGMY